MSPGAHDRVKGDDLFHLASLVLSRSRLLIQFRARTRVPKNRRLTALGIGFDADVESLLTEKRALASFLLRASLEREPDHREAALMLAQTLYENGDDEEALALLRPLAAGGGVEAEVTRRLARILLERGEPEAAAVVARQEGVAEGVLSRIDLVDYDRFDEWVDRTGGERFPLREGDGVRQGSITAVVDGVAETVAHSLPVRQLAGARYRNLTMAAGVIPVVGGLGVYDIAHVQALGNRPDVPLVAREKLFVRSDPGPKTVIDGPCIVPLAARNYFGNYFHAVAQVYARIVCALDSLGSAGDIFQILLPAGTPAWGVTFLEMAGVTPSRIRFTPPSGQVTIREGLLLPMKWEICPLEIEALRARLRIRFPYAQADKRHYLLRAGAGNIARRLVNEEAFIAVAREYGYEPVDPLALGGIPQQAELFRGTGRFVSPAGSAYTNILFAPPEAEMIHVVPKLFWGSLFADLSAACQQRVTFLFGDFIAGDRNVSSPHHPYAADPEGLRRLLAGEG